MLYNFFTSLNCRYFGNRCKLYISILCSTLQTSSGIIRKSFELHEARDFVNTPKEMQGNLDFFYKRQFPALNNIYIHKNNIFLRHGIERHNRGNYKDYNIAYPPDSSYMDLLGVNAYPVEVDMLPLCVGGNMLGHCSDHDRFMSWHKLMGVISLTSFKQMGGTLQTTIQRDHLYATSNIPMKYWTFIVNEEEFKTINCNATIGFINDAQCPMITDKNLQRFFSTDFINQEIYVVICRDEHKNRSYLINRYIFAGFFFVLKTYFWSMF